MYAQSPPVTELLFHGSPGKLKPRLVEKGAKLVRTGHPDHDRRGIRHSPKSCFAFKEGVLAGLKFLGELPGYKEIVAQVKRHGADDGKKPNTEEIWCRTDF